MSGVLYCPIFTVAFYLDIVTNNNSAKLEVMHTDGTIFVRH